MKKQGLDVEHVKVILFDFDDVLAYPDISKSLHEILGVNEEKIKTVTNETIKEKEGEYQYLPNVEKELEYMKSYYETILKKLELDDSYLQALLDRHMRPRKKLYPGVLGLLEKLKNNYQLGMISNAFPSRRVNEFDRLGITKYFKSDLIIISAEVGYWKPDLEIFELAIKRAGADPENILYIDDKEKFLNAARKSGIINLVRISETDESACQVIPKVTDLFSLL
jgi:putative hydrolase of the HAD superfamily